MGLIKKKQKDLDIAVQVGRAHTKLVSISLNGDRTINQALHDAGLTRKDTEVVSVNGAQVDNDELDSYTLEDGDRVVLVKNVSGGLL
jgi:sulfur carrier protein ThiS